MEPTDEQLTLDSKHSCSGRTVHGVFVLADLPETPGLLVVWHERAAPWSKELQPSASDKLVVQLQVSKPLVPTHPDKNGKPYANATADKSYR